MHNIFSAQLLESVLKAGEKFWEAVICSAQTPVTGYHGQLHANNAECCKETWQWWIHQTFKMQWLWLWRTCFSTDLYSLDSCKKRNGPGVMVVSFMILGFGEQDFQVFLRLNPVQQSLGVDLWTFSVVGGVSLSVDKVSNECLVSLIWLCSGTAFVWYDKDDAVLTTRKMTHGGGGGGGGGDMMMMMMMMRMRMMMMMMMINNMMNNGVHV